MNPEDDFYFCDNGVWYKVYVTPYGVLKKGKKISLENVPLKYRNPIPSA
jgi:hypothetical protein